MSRACIISLPLLFFSAVAEYQNLPANQRLINEVDRDMNHGNSAAPTLSSTTEQPPPLPPPVYQNSPANQRLINEVDRDTNHGNSAAAPTVSATTVSPPPLPPPVPVKYISEELLDGILTTGFDHESCISRFEAHLYRKPSPHKPTKHLISKLRTYESLHRKCGPGTKPYNRTIAKLAKSGINSTDSSDEECKYIIWIPINGLGNRMLSLISTFLYAMLTDRVLLVEFNQDMSGLFCQPFVNSTWESPTTFSSNRRQIPTFQDLLLTKPTTNKTSNDKETAMPAVFVNLLSVKKEQMKNFPCDDSQTLLNKVPVLIMMSDQYFIPSLFITPSFQQQLILMFPAEKQSAIFHHLGRYLFLPANPAWGLITRFYQTYLSKADKRIGLQIRLFAPKHTSINTVMDQLLSCTLSNHILPEINDTETETVTHQVSANLTTKAIFVASLYQDFSEQLTTMYWSKPTKTGEIVEVFQATHEGVQKFGNNSHHIKALTEMYLLSLSDVLVTSGQSTFGYVAQGLGGLKPWVMTKRYKLTDTPCTRGWSMDPCFQFPPAYDCKKKADVEHMSVVFGRTTMKKCKDMGRGSQMVGEDDLAR